MGQEETVTMSSQKLRQLGNLEKYSVANVFLGLDTCIAMAARYTTAENTPLTRDILFPALRSVLETHPILGVRLDGKHTSTDIAFFRLPSVDLSRLVEFSESQDLEAALEKWLTRRWEDTLEDMPLWRVEVLSDNTVIFAMHHVVGDGISLGAFHKSLFRALQQPAYTHADSDSSIVAVPNDKSLSPPIEAVADVRPSLWTTLSEIFHVLVPRYWNRGTYAWTGNPCPPVGTPVHTQVRLLSFTPTETSKFSRICKSHNATVSSVLYQLAISVLSRLISQTPDGAKYRTIPVAFPVSLRGTTGASDDVFCYHASSFDSYPSLRDNANFTWTTAAQLANTLKQQRTASIERIGFLSWVAGDYTKYFHGQLGKKRARGLRISNPGRVALPDVEGKGPWRVGDMFFGQCDSLAGPAIIMNAIGSADGALNLTLTWGKESVERAFVEEFVKMFRGALLGV